MSGPEGVAIVAMSCRFPGADSPEELWRNLVEGVESIRRFSDAELREAGVPEAELRRESYVRAAGVLSDVEGFDAELFGMTADEAALTAPEHRLFLECCVEALERGGHGAVGGSDDPTAPQVGVFGGAGLNTYFMRNVASDPERLLGVSRYQAVLANDKDFLATRVAYRLDLRGPAITLQTACSTSLVAVHLACQSVLTGECDLALAGGATVVLPQVTGYRYREGGIASPDGRCRPFDADARGTVSSSGVGVVLVKRLSDALADGDPIEAVILGSAVNNDGGSKAGFTAPSVEGQAAAVSEALEIAEVDAETVGYVEAHGTATPLGDPIEVAALREALGDGTGRTGHCFLGSVKGNLGHTDTAAGVAGLIKTVLALRARRIPPTLHFRQPNPRLDIDGRLFRIAGEATDWPAPGAAPRRAGVSSFGIGGTNAHAVLEEAPVREPGSPSRRSRKLLVLSANSEPALERAAARLAKALEERPELDLADVAHTLARGRRAYRWRRAVVARDTAGAVEALTSGDPAVTVSGDAHRAEAAGAEVPVAFLFPGQGAQYPGMGADLYRDEPVYRRAVDRCAEILRPHLDIDLRELLDPAEPGAEEAAERLRRTEYAQPALFATGYALGRLWSSLGVRPRALLGHSIGEYTAACLAGVFSLEDALGLVAARGRLMQAMPPGAMLHVAAPAAELEPLLVGDLALAAVNAPHRAVVSGPEEAIAELAGRLAEEGVEARRLRTSHAFHSPMMEPILERFAARVGSVERRAPEVPFVSNLTGDWITAEQATDPAYWSDHLRRTVRFGDGVRRLAGIEGLVLLELGPGRTLAALGQENAVGPVLASLPSPRETGSAPDVLLRTLGELWTTGVEIDWRAYWEGERRLRVRLPTYPFERRRHWIDPAPAAEPSEPAAGHPLAAASDPTEQIIERQMQVLASQLAVLRRHGALE